MTIIIDGGKHGHHRSGNRLPKMAAENNADATQPSKETIANNNTIRNSNLSFSYSNGTTIVRGVNRNEESKPPLLLRVFEAFGLK